MTKKTKRIHASTIPTHAADKMNRRDEDAPEGITINPKKLAVILGIIVTLSGAVYSTYGVVNTFLDTLATKVEVKQSEIMMY